MRKIFTILASLALLGLLSFNSMAQDSFTALNGIPGGDIREVHKDASGALYTVVRSEGKIFTSDDNGSTWDHFDVGTTDVYAFYVDNTDLYYFTYSNMYKSTDEGSTWSKVNSNFASFINIRIAHKSPIDPNTWFVEGECEGVYVSTDDGVTWTNIVTETCGNGSGEYKLTITASGDIYYENRTKGVFRHINPVDGVWSSDKLELVFAKQTLDDDYSLRIALSMSGRIFVTHRDINGQFSISSSLTGDGGSFSEFTIPVTTSALDASVISTGFNGNIFLTSYFDGEMYELTDENIPTWTPKTHPLNQYATDNGIDLIWFSSSEVYACTNLSGIFRSFDGGVSWQMANGSGNKALNYGWISDIEVLPNGNIIAFPQYAPKGNWVSTDQGTTFTYNSFGGGESRMRENGYGLVKLQDNSLIMSNLAGAMRSSDGINWSVISTDNAPLFLPVGSSDVYYLRDSETNLFKTTLSDITDGGGVTLATVSAGLPNNSFIRRVILHDGDIYVDLQNYTNGGQWEIWKVETSVAPFTSQKLILPFATDQLVGLESLGNKLYISNQDQVAYSSTQGASWATINYVFHERLLGISQDGNEGIAVAYRGGVAITQDDGLTWSAKTVPTSGGLVTSLASDAGGNFIAALSGGPVSKFEDKLVLSAGELPPPVNITWQPLNGPYGGQFNGLTKDSQNNIYGYSRGAGLYKLASGSQKWQRLNPGLGEGRIAYVDDSDNLYAADYSRIVKSTDKGATWSILTEYVIIDIHNLVIADNGNIVASSTEGGEGLYVSDDNGATFSKPLGSGPKGVFYELIKSGSGRLWTHQRNNGQSTIYTSTDNGISWLALNTIDLSNGKEVLALNVLEGNAVAIVTDSDILRSTDDGANWNSIKGSITTIEHYDAGPPAESSVYLAPDNSYYFYNLQEVYKSTDQGQTWSEVSSLKQGLYDYEKSDFVWLNSDIIASSPNRGILRSVGGASSWSDYIDDLTAVFSYGGSFVGAGSNLLTGPNGGGAIHSSNDDGQSFTRNTPNEGYFDGIFKDQNGRFIRFGSGVSYSDDNGITWSSNMANDYFFAKVTAYKNESSGEITYYALRDKNNPGEFAKSTDLMNWTTLGSSGYTFSGQNAEDLIAAENDILYVKGYNNLSGKSEFHRIAFGASENITDPSTNQTQRLQVNLNASEPTDANDIKKVFVLYGNQGKLAYSADGFTWKTAAAPPAQDGRQFKIISNGYYFINDSETGRLWLSKDEGASWQFTNGFEEGMFEVEINPGNGYAYAISRGQVLQKSNNIILEDDQTNPAIASPGGFAPENGAINVALTFQLILKYDENVIPVTGKKIRLLEVSNPGTPLEIFDATDGAISTDGTTITFTPGINIDYSTEYFVAMDAGAYTDIFGNPSPAITSTSDWAFTTLALPDNADPSITLVTSDLTYVKGSSKVFEINVTDNIEVDALGTKIYYREISDPASTSFNSADLTASGNDSPSLNFSISSLDSWYDAIGLEFYFEVADKAGNTARLPDTNNTYFYSYIDYTNSKPKLDNEQLSFGTTASSFRIISVPYQLTDNQIATQFDELGEFSKEKFRIGHYNNGTEEIDEYPDNLNTLGRGEGYWVILRNFTDIELDNAKVFENNRDDFFEMTLKQGWNQIGNPYPVPISWDEIKVQNANVRDLKMYVNGAFSTEAVLPPFQGGFVYADGNIPNLKIRFSGITSGGRVAEIAPVLDADHWELPIVIQQGEFSNQIGGIGMHKESAEGKDRFDDYNPPTITHRLDLSFPSETGLDFAKSVVPQKDSYSWEFTAHAEGEEMVTLSWDNSKFGDNDIGLWLYDEERVAFVDMRANTEYKYLATPSKKFKIYYGSLPELEILPSTSLLGEPWPNPTIGAINIPFAITQQLGRSQVIVRIYNTKGQEVAEVVDNKFEPGTHTILWSPDRGNNEFGLNLIKWTVIGENGEQIEETRRILIK